MQPGALCAANSRRIADIIVVIDRPRDDTGFRSIRMVRNLHGDYVNVLLGELTPAPGDGY
jgi:hypothetical protein